MKKPFISFIIPVYNRCHFLKTCLSSVLQVKSISYEIILIDDASTDGSTKICEDYDLRYDFIHLIKFQKNSGAGVAKQAGLARASGTYLYFLDSDDILDPGGIFKTLEELQKFPEIELCRVNYYEQTRDVHTKIKMEEIHQQSMMKVDDFLENVDFLNGFGFMWRFIFRRDFINKYGLRIPPIRYAEDFIFIAQSLLVAKKILLCPFCCCVYQRHVAENSITKNIQPDMERKGFYFVLHYIEKFVTANIIQKKRLYQIEYFVLSISFPTLLYGAFKYHESVYERGSGKCEGLISYYRRNGGDKTLLLLRYCANLAYHEMTKDKRIVLCPAGHAAIKFASVALVQNISITGFLDNYKKGVIVSKGRKIPIFCFEEFAKMKMDDKCVFVISIYEKEFLQQLAMIPCNQLHVFSYRDLLSNIQRKIQTM